MSNISPIVKELYSVAESSLQKRPRSNKLFAVFAEAIREGNLELAEASLRLAEISIMLCQPGSSGVQSEMDDLVAGYTTLWMLRHPEATRAA